MRFAVAKRIVDRAEAYGIAREDVIIDPLAMPIAGTLNGVYRSEDAGGSWVRVASGLSDVNVRALSAGPRPGWLAAATGDGVYLSSGRGETWQRHTDVLGADYFRAVAAGEALVAAGWKGTFLAACRRERFFR